MRDDHQLLNKDVGSHWLTMILVPIKGTMTQKQLETRANLPDLSVVDFGGAWRNEYGTGNLDRGGSGV